MESLVAYKVALLIVLAAVPTSVGASAYYNQQQTNTLNNHISDLTSKLDNANNNVSRLNGLVSNFNGQVSNLNNQLGSQNSQISQLESQNSQLTTQIQQLKSEIANLNQTRQTTQNMILSKGTILLPGYPTSCYTYNESCLTGGVYYINFTVPTNFISAVLNVSFSLGCSDCPRLSLLTPSQYGTFIKCNCLETGNYSSVPTTWSSPQSTSYTAQVAIPTAGLWILAFQLGPGITNPPNGPYMIDETVILAMSIRA